MGLLVGLGIGIGGSIIAAVIVAIVVAGWQRRTSPLGRVLNFSRDRKLVVVVPTLPSADPAHQRVIAGEDMLALHAIHGALSAAQWPWEAVDVAFPSQVEPTTDRNLVLICAPKRNDVTRAVLGHQLIQAQLGSTFRQQANNQDRWEIWFDGAPVPSPSYEEVDDLIKAGTDPERGPLTDHALLAKVQSPWAPHAKVLIVAGIRAFGTWGAAEYLQEHARDIQRRTQGKNFAMIIRVHYRAFRITGKEETSHFKLLE